MDKNKQTSWCRALGDSIHTYSLIHCHSWSKRNGIYDPQENSPSEIVNHVVFGTWERAPWKPRNRSNVTFTTLWCSSGQLSTTCYCLYDDWLLLFDIPSQFSYFSIGFTDKQPLKLTLMSYNQGYQTNMSYFIRWNMQEQIVLCKIRLALQLCGETS